jgi:hypothetical protein
VELTEDSYTRLFGLVQFGGDRKQKEVEDVLGKDGEGIVSRFSFSLNNNYTLPVPLT